MIALIISAAPSTCVTLLPGSSLPIHLATEQSTAKDVVKYLLLQDFPINLGTLDEIGKPHIVHRFHRHSRWHVTVDYNDKYIQVVEEILSSANPAEIIALYQSVGPAGRKVCDTLYSQIKSSFRKYMSLLRHYKFLPFYYCGSDGTEVFHVRDHGPSEELHEEDLQDEMNSSYA